MTNKKIRDDASGGKATLWQVSAYEGGWDCIRDEHGQILVKAATANSDQLALMAEAPALLNALENAARRLRAGALMSGNSPEYVDAMMEPFLAVIAAAKGKPHD